jgi:hypothetical protein
MHWYGDISHICDEIHEYIASTFDSNSWEINPSHVYENCSCHILLFLEHIQIILGNFSVVELANNNSNITNEHPILHNPQRNSISNQGGVLHMGLRVDKTIA